MIRLFTALATLFARRTKVEPWTTIVSPTIISYIPIGKPESLIWVRIESFKQGHELPR